MEHTPNLRVVIVTNVKSNKVDEDFIDENIDAEAVEPAFKGLSEQDRNYRYNMIKGRIAETLI